MAWSTGKADHFCSTIATPSPFRPQRSRRYTNRSVQFRSGAPSGARACAGSSRRPLGDHPLAASMTTSPDPVDTPVRQGAGDEVDVLVVGAGITGIYQLYTAREAGFSVQLLEAGDGVGGTWFWNRYPEARFDSESYTYGYLFSKELFDEWEWQEHFAGQPEIERYLNHVVDRFDLRRHV